MFLHNQQRRVCHSGDMKIAALISAEIELFRNKIGLFIVNEGGISKVVGVHIMKKQNETNPRNLFTTPC